MSLTEPEIDERIKILQGSMDGVSEVSFDGETTKYRSIEEIKRAISYYKGLKKKFTTQRGKYRAFHKSINRGF